MGKAILVVCKDLHQAQILYFQYIRCFGVPTNTMERNHLECVYAGAKFCFVTEAQLDIVQEGNHDAKILSGADVQRHILRWLSRGMF